MTAREGCRGRNHRGRLLDGLGRGPYDRAEAGQNGR
jgi:hypothetical protein